MGKVNKDDITQAQWAAYRIVQNMGLYNMMSGEAVRDSGLDKDVYFSILTNYSELKKKFEVDDVEAYFKKGADDVDDE
jgi:hypothetical protein